MPTPEPHELIALVKSTLADQGINADKKIARFGQVQASVDRKRGIEFGIDRHVRGLVLSLLSNQRPWRPIEENLERIDEIFFYYDAEWIKETEPNRLVAALLNIKCGNRSIHKQMADLAANIETFERIIRNHGSLDNFVTDDDAEEVATRLSRPGAYKLRQVGFTLAMEYLRNVGIGAPKPDQHVIRFISGERLGFVNGTPTPEQAYHVLVQLADLAGVNRTYFDNLVWLFCAEGYGEICGKPPRCEICRLAVYCNRPTAHH